MKYKDYRETKQHGEADFPLQYYPEKYNMPETTMPLHWHRECEIIRVQKEEFCVFLDSTEYRGKEGDLFFLPSGTLHRAEPQPALYECVVFLPEMLYGRSNGRTAERLLPFLSGSAEPLHIPADPRSPLHQTACRLFDTLRRAAPAWELSVCGILLELFGALYAEHSSAIHSSQSRNEHQRTAMTLLLRWMEENYPKRVTLSELASVAGVNERYLCRLFREFTGTTPMDYLNRLRVDRACFEMSVKSRNATEAAYESGFNDPSYFSKVFRKYRAMSPLDFRKQVEAEKKIQDGIAKPD